MLIQYKPDISLAETLPSEFYSDEIFRTLKRKIFSRSWQYCGDSDAVKVPGQTTSILFT
ncbi:MAG: hypothetical protein R2942_02740 [Ignavibacteria bacterium]